MNEDQIILPALEQLEQHTGLKGEWKLTQNQIDGELYLDLTRPLHFFVEVKKELRQQHMDNILALAETYQPFMVVAENIFPTLKEKLREKRIAYLDGAGNIYIHTGGNYIWIDGHKPPVEKKPVTNRAFTKTGLKTVFYLLLKKDAINLPYRQLAEATDVALGNITNVIEGLKEAGFIIQLDKYHLKLQNKRALFERWLAGYGETLKPTLHLGTYRFWNHEKEFHWNLQGLGKGDTVWGGEPAGEALTNYLMPQEYTLYTNEKSALVTKLKLIPDAKGNVHLFTKFWKEEDNKEKLAPPLLVYADLLLTNDPRCVETAEIILKKYLKNELG